MKKHFNVWLCPTVVARLKKLALKTGYERGEQTTWVDLLSEGADIVLKNNDEVGRAPAENTQLVAT